MTLDEQAPDPRWQLMCELWQALGRLVCAAANAEMWLRNCYYTLRPETDGPAKAEGATCDNLITMCRESAEQRTDLDPAKVAILTAALEDLRAANKDRNRLFHDSWQTISSGNAWQIQSVRKAMPASRTTSTADVVSVERTMGQATSGVIAAWFDMDSSRDLEFYEVAGIPRVRRR